MGGILLAANPGGVIIGGGLPYNAQDNDFSGGTATASVTFRSDGYVTNQNAVDLGDWITPQGFAPGDYEIRATPNPDTPDAGTMNTWLALTSSRTWSETQSGVGTSAKTFQIEIRLGTTVRFTGNVTLTANVESGA